MTGRAKSVIQGAAGSTVSGGYVAALLRFAVAKGADREALLRQSGFRADDFGDRDGRASLTRCAALMAASAEASGDPDFALHFGEALEMEDISVALLAAGAARSVAEGVSLFNRFGALVLDDGAGAGGLLRLVQDGRGAWLEFRGGAGAGMRPFVEAGFAWCVRQIRALPAAAGRSGDVLKAVHLRGAAPADRSEYDRIFGVRVVFGAERDALLLEGAFLADALPPAHPYIARLLQDRAEALLGGLETSRTVRGQVEGRLAERLASGAIDMGLVARDLGWSRQTLGRRLKAEGSSFEQVLDDLRRRLALDFLNEEGIAVKEVSARLGFSEPAAFSRAFRRWTGSSPNAARHRRAQS